MDFTTLAVAQSICGGGQGGAVLPAITAQDDGKVLGVNDGALEWKTLTTPPQELPDVTSSDNGKVLMVKDGAWAKGKLPLFVDYDTNTKTLDKTYKQIYDAIFTTGCILRWYSPGTGGTLNNVPCTLLSVGINSEQTRQVIFFIPEEHEAIFEAESDNDYPVKVEEK